jgi:hypothetical protein
MEPNERSGRDVAIPAIGLSSLRRILQEEAGPLPAINALHGAGYQSGEALWDALRRGAGKELAALDETSFWSKLTAALSKRGWGSLAHSAAHPGIGLLASADWAESQGVSGSHQPSCTFSTGMLSALLSGAAGDPVAVLEVTCRTRGDERCTFAFGSAATVHDLYGLLLEGQALEAALASL